MKLANRSLRHGIWVACLALSACGGGGGGGSGAQSQSTAALAQQCSANNPYRADARSATTAGTLGTEKSWVRAYFDEAYLWYGEVPVVDAAAPAYSNDTATGFYTSIDGYFEALKVTAKDRFSFTYPTKAWDTLFQSGQMVGDGIQWHYDSPKPPRNMRVVFVEPASPAASAGVQRGDTLVSVNGVSADDATTAGVAVLNEALFGSTTSAYSYVFSRAGVTQGAKSIAKLANLTTDPVPQTTVLTDANGGKVGYLLFNDHLATAEGRLITAINALKAQNVGDLVLDLRYNGGGYLYIASELAYMIAGPTRTAGKTFEALQYNSKRSAQNQATPFYDSSTQNQALPTLNLGRVYVLTGSGTCSASESIINSLQGVDVSVQRIGATTCGKPYGFQARDNCGISYFPIEFQGVNAKGWGDYASGFTPTCTVADDLEHGLGDAAEARLAAALTLRTTGVCPPGSDARAQPSRVTAALAGAGTLVKHPVRESAYRGGRE